jgi:hypothetical protein
VYLIASSPTMGLLEEKIRRPVRVLCPFLHYHRGGIAKLCHLGGGVLEEDTDRPFHISIQIYFDGPKCILRAHEIVTDQF